MFDRLDSRLTIKGRVVAQSALRIGTTREATPVGTQHAVMRDPQGAPFVPGSSFKGVLRGHLEAVVRGMVPPDVDLRPIACDPTGDERRTPCITGEELASLRTSGRRDGGPPDDAELAALIADKACIPCSTFGSPWVASHVIIEDLPVVPETWVGEFQVRDGVAIDRDKGTAAGGRLYDYEVVPAGTAFALTMIADNLRDWQLGLLWLGLRDLRAGRVALGGFTSRGLGWIALDPASSVELSTADSLLSQLARGEASTGEPITEAQARDWVRALRAEVHRRTASVAGADPAAS